MRALLSTGWVLVLTGCLSWSDYPVYGHHDQDNLPDCPLGSASVVDGGAPDGGGQDCSEQVKLIHVVDENRQFSTFNPQTLEFTDLGLLDCPAESGATPFAMTLDRKGVAWVVYSSGELFWVNIETTRCERSPFVPGQEGLEIFGVAFVLDGRGTTGESLYLAGTTAERWGTGKVTLARMSPVDLKPVPLCLLPDAPDLSGTGSGELWGYFQFRGPPQVSRLSTESGREDLTYSLSSLEGLPEDWAFAFWGGDLWIFLKRQTDASTHVYRVTNLHLPNPTVTRVLYNTTRRIVGAGVSTCAPLVLH